MKKIILIVDDDRLTLSTAQKLLGGEYKGVAVNSGKQAFKYLERHMRMDCPCFTSGTRISFSLAISPSVERMPLRDWDIFSVACRCASSASYTVLVNVHFFTSRHPLQA